VLHRKETFLPLEHPLRAKFARLTAIEESKGLFDESNRIGTRNQWEQVLAGKGLTLRGHRLMRRGAEEETVRAVLTGDRRPAVS
jgi:hypothetical protein